MEKINRLNNNNNNNKPYTESKKIAENRNGFKSHIQGILLCTSMASIVIPTSMFLGYSMDLVINRQTPATLPQYTLTNGKRKIILQSMSHIAHKDFYTELKKDIGIFQKNGGIVFYEGVYSEDNNKKDYQWLINNVLPKTNYKEYAKSIGLTHDNGDAYINGVASSYNIDMSISEFKRRYAHIEKDNLNSKEKLNILKYTDTSNKNAINIDSIRKYIPNYLVVATYNKFLKQSDFSLKKEKKDNINAKEQLLIHDRNKILVEAINNSSSKEIFVIYGAAHILGIYQQLMDTDASWKVTKVKNSVVYLSHAK